MTGYEWFCAYLAATGSHRQGQAWQCPAHDDARPSLSVNRAADDTALFYCHAGCDRDQVLSALKLTWPVAINGSDEEPAAAAQRLVGRLHYPTPDLGGGRTSGSRRRGKVIEEIHHVYIPDQVRLERLRYEDGSKEIKWERKVGRDWVYGLEGHSLDSLPLYASQQVLQALGAGEPIVLCESESSVDALYAAGVFATTWAGGAAHPQLQALRRSLTGGLVVLIPDNDPAGVKCAHQIQEALRDVCRLETMWPEPNQDARDLLRALGGEGLRARLEALFTHPTRHSDGDTSGANEHGHTPSAMPSRITHRRPRVLGHADDSLTPDAALPESDAWTRSRADVLLVFRQLRAAETDADRSILAAWLTDPALRALVGYRESVIHESARGLDSVSAIALPGAVLAVVTRRATASRHPEVDDGPDPSAMIQPVSAPGESTLTVWLTEPMWGRDPDNGEAFQSNRHVVHATHVIQDPVMTTIVTGDGEVVADWPTPMIERLVWHDSGTVDDAAVTAEQHDGPHASGGQPPPTGSPEWRAQVQRQFPRAYEPWTGSEDEQLRSEFGQGQNVNQMAEAHERTVGAINARLELLGLLD